MRFGYQIKKFQKTSMLAKSKDNVNYGLPLKTCNLDNGFTHRLDRTALFSSCVWHREKTTENCHNYKEDSANLLAMRMPCN